MSHFARAADAPSMGTVGVKINVVNGLSVKEAHAKIIDELTAIINNAPAPRVGDAAPPRVAAMPATTSTDATSPTVVRAMPWVHQRQTRRNTPMPTIFEVEEPPERTAPPSEATAPPKARRVQPTRRAKSRTVHGQLIGSKRNNVKVASRKRIQRLIDIQQDQDRLRKLRHGIDDMLDQQAAQPPREHPYISFEIPTPK